MAATTTRNGTTPSRGGWRGGRGGGGRGRGGGGGGGFRRHRAVPASRTPARAGSSKSWSSAPIVWSGAASPVAADPPAGSVRPVVISTPTAPTLCAATMSYSGASPTTTTGPGALPARRIASWKRNGSGFPMQIASRPLATSSAFTMLPAPGRSRPSTGYARSLFDATNRAPPRSARWASASRAYVRCRSRPTTTVSGSPGSSRCVRYSRIADGLTPSAAAGAGGCAPGRSSAVRTPMPTARISSRNPFAPTTNTSFGFGPSRSR